MLNTPSRFLKPWGYVLILLLAFALRLIALEQRPLHFDEGINMVFGQGGLANVLATTFKNGDTDPPVHRLILGGWMGLAGASAFAIRYFSVVCGVLWLAVSYRLARRLGLGTAVAALLLLMMAGSSYAVNYTQQAKGYAFAALMEALSFAILDFGFWILDFEGTKIQNLKSKISEAGYVVAIMLMLGTHYYTAPVLAMQWVWLWGAGRGAAALRRLAVLQALACLPVAIWVLFTFRAVLTGSLGLSHTPPIPAGQLLANIWADMTLGEYFQMDHISIIEFVIIALAWCGRSYFDRNPKASRWLTSALIPIIFTLLLQLRITFFSSRFLLYLLPFVLMPIAAGVVALAEWLSRRIKVLGVTVGALSAAGLVGLMGLGLTAFYRAPIDPKEDFRSTIRAIRPQVQAGDAAVFGYIWLDGMVASYAPEINPRLTWYDDAEFGAQVAQRMGDIAQRHTRVWFFNYTPTPNLPTPPALDWLRGNAAQAMVYPAGQGSMTPILFVNTTPLSAQTNTVVFDQRLQLRYTPLNSEIQAQNATILPLRLEWTRLRQTDHDDLGLFVHVIGKDGQRVAQSDSDAVNGFAPHFTWQINQPITDQRALVLPPLPPGTYTIIGGAFSRRDGARLKLADGGDFATLGAFVTR